MGRVRRHCDAVTAFMFQPKAQDPRHNLLTHHPKELKFKSKCLLLFFASFFFVMTSLQHCAPTEDWIVFSAHWVLLMCRSSIKLYVICLLKSTWFNELFKRGYCPISYFTALNLAKCFSIHIPVSFMSWLTREEDQVNISWWSLSSGLQAFKQNFLVWQRNKKWIPWWSEKYVLTESLKMSASLKTCLIIQG